MSCTTFNCYLLVRQPFPDSGHSIDPMALAYLPDGGDGATAYSCGRSSFTAETEAFVCPSALHSAAGLQERLSSCTSPPGPALLGRDGRKKALGHGLARGSLNDFGSRTGYLLHLLDHLSDAAGADTRAEPAEDAAALVHHVLVGPVREDLARDGAVIAQRHAHSAVAAGPRGTAWSDRNGWSRHPERSSSAPGKGYQVDSRRGIFSF